ncbi:MAG: T9SS type A sorting domain-containing protein [Saprospiraceae bacterium]|nr:T9SS type A sorting domain-containing protein [Saprospiraceae bacterium]
MSRFIRFLIICWTPVCSFAQISFLPYESRSVNSYPQSVAIADFNRDGRNDLAVMTGFFNNPATDYKLLVYYQNQQRQLDPAIAFPTVDNFQGSRAMVVQDLNADLYPDIVFIFQDSVGIIYNNPNGGFLPATKLYSGTITSALAVGDLNHDGIPDIATTNSNELFLTLFTGSANNTYTVSHLPTPYNCGYDMEIADFNNDGLNDLAYIASYPVGGFFITYQQLDGTFGTPQFFLPVVQQSFPTTPYSFGLGDLNNDGKADLVTTTPWNLPVANLNLWIQGDNGISSQPQVRSAFDIPEPVEVVDINCDGKNEILALNGGWLRMMVYDGYPSGDYNNLHYFDIPYSSHYGAKGLAVGDLNGDGMKDAAIAGYNEVTLLYNNAQKSVFNPIFSNYAQAEIRTTIEMDTLFTIENVLKRVSTDTVDYVRLMRTDSLLATQYWVQKLTTVDTVFLYVRGTCAGTLTDTIHYIYAFSENFLAGIDTTLLGTSIDSFFLPRPEIPLTYSFYPNPGNKDLFVKFSTNPKLHFISVDLFAADGKRVGVASFEMEWPAGNLLVLHLSHLPAGTYVLRFQSEKISFTEKWVKVDR